MISSLPTSTQDDLGRDRWTLGPERLLGHIFKQSIVGVFPNHQRDLAGPGGGDVSLTTLQSFAIGLPGSGWNAGSSPIMPRDHEVEEWTIPLDLTAGKTVVLGGRPWKSAAEFNYYVERPGTLNSAPVESTPLFDANDRPSLAGRSRGRSFSLARVGEVRPRIPDQLR